MIKRVTKKAILEGARFCQINGYWSDEVREYLDNFSTTARNKIDSILYSEYVSANTNSMYHDLLLENDLLENKVNNCLVSSPEQQKADEKKSKIVEKSNSFYKVVITFGFYKPKSLNRFKDNTCIFADMLSPKV